MADLRRSLLVWFHKHGRPLPWRQTHDPYRIWVSEIMLQQTTVVAVAPYYERFLKRFPDVQSLAAANEADVLALWEGLGYYRRGRNLHAAARAIVNERDGRPPETLDGWQRLPGVGRYTAGAIVSFALNQPAPIVEANTQRLYSRLLGLKTDPASTAGQGVLWEFAERLASGPRPGPVNQALIELGGQVCKPREPDCSGCPIRRHCAAYREGIQHDIPVRRTQAPVIPRCEVLVAVQRKGRLLMRRRRAEETWAGLWDLVRLEAPQEWFDAAAAPSARDLERWAVGQVQTTFGLQVQIARRLPCTAYAITRYRVRLHRLIAECLMAPRRPPDDFEWAPYAVLSERPLPTSTRAFVRAAGWADAAAPGDRAR